MSDASTESSGDKSSSPGTAASKEDKLPASSLSKHLAGDSSHFACDQCKRSFRRLHHLKRHRAIHSTERPFNCTICKKNFPREDSLQRHVLMHKQKDVFGKTKGARACLECAAAKVRCTHTLPCRRCASKSLQCEYPREMTVPRLGS